MFEFSIKAMKYLREGYIEIRMLYRFCEYYKWSQISEIIDEDRFCDDKNFAKRVIDNLFDRARREVFNKIDEPTTPKP